MNYFGLFDPKTFKLKSDVLRQSFTKIFLKALDLHKGNWDGEKEGWVYTS